MLLRAGVEILLLKLHDLRQKGSGTKRARFCENGENHLISGHPLKETCQFRMTENREEGEYASPGAMRVVPGLKHS